MAAAASAAPRRIPARELLAPDELAALRERVEWKGLALIAHAWAVILGSIALVAIFPNPLTYVLAVMLIGSRQLGLAILMHDGAHGCLSRNEARNLALSQWLCAYPVFADTLAYRRYHLAHHAHTQQDERPRSRAVGAVPDHQGELSPQVLARPHRSDRLPAEEGAAPQCARRPVMAGGAAPAPFRREARAADRRQRRAARRARAGRRLVGLSAAVAGPAADLDDGHHAHPQHRRACGGADSDDPLRNTRTTKASLHRAHLHRALFRQLSPRASPAVLRAVLQPAQGCMRS